MKAGMFNASSRLLISQGLRWKLSTGDTLEYDDMITGIKEEEVEEC